MKARSFAVFATLFLSACVEPQPPSEAMSRLQAACKAGDTEACKSVVEIEQRERERMTEIWVGDDDDVFVFN